jgi:hypothetical protein
VISTVAGILQVIWTVAGYTRYSCGLPVISTVAGSRSMIRVLAIDTTEKACTRHTTSLVRGIEV